MSADQSKAQKWNYGSKIKVSVNEFLPSKLNNASAISVVLPDYLIGRTHANDDGHFGLKGEQTFNSLDSGSAFLRIEHNCSRKPVRLFGTVWIARDINVLAAPAAGCSR